MEAGTARIPCLIVGVSGSRASWWALAWAVGEARRRGARLLVVHVFRPPAGGYSFTRERLAAWGVPWPPPPGWRAALERGEDNNPGKTTP